MRASPLLFVCCVFGAVACGDGRLGAEPAEPAEAIGWSRAKSGAPDSLARGHALAPGEALVSAGGAYRLIYQGDGNLVLYRESDGAPLWDSRTSGASAGRTVLQTDGNLVVYDASDVPRWATWTHGTAADRLVVQADGNLVLYDAGGTAHWNSGTVQPVAARAPAPAAPAPAAPADPAPADPAPAQPAPAPGAGEAFEVVFATPTATSNGVGIERRLLDLVGQAAPGSEVRVAMYQWTTVAFADALGDAADRGADVRVVLDGGGASAAVVRALHARLGPDRVHACTAATGTACVGDRINHNKFFLFSALSDGSRDVVVQSSGNLNAGLFRKHNNAVIVRGDRALYDIYAAYWTDLRGDRPNPDYYWSDTGRSGAKAYFYPRASGDTILSVLDNVRCGPGAELHLGMAMFTDGRQAIAERLAAMKRAGCAIHAIVGAYPNIGSPGDDVERTLRAAGIPLKVVAEPNIHSKYLLVDAPYAGNAASRRIVFTGSHNYTKPALRRNDEALLKIPDAAVYEVYRANWDLIWDQP